MKFALSEKSLVKRLSFLLASVNISLGLATDISWRQLYKLLKKASKVNKAFDISKKDLKNLSKDIALGNFEVNETTTITELFNYVIENQEEQEETFAFVSIVSTFIKSFITKHPMLLI